MPSPEPCACGPCAAARDQKGFSWGRACARLVDKVRRLNEELRACRELRDKLVRLTTDRFGDYPDEPEIQEWKDACAREELEEALKEATR